MYFLRRLLRSFNICSKLLQMFYQSVVASVLFYTVVCWGGSISKKDTSRLDKLIRRAGSVVGTKLDSLVTVAESRTLDKLLDIIYGQCQPPSAHHVVSPVKTVRCYPNNKPWVTREVKTVLNKKKAAFRSRDREGHESSTAGGETLCEGSQGQLQEKGGAEAEGKQHEGAFLRPQVQHAQDRLQFAYQPGVGVEDAILYLLHRAHSHLDKGSGTVRILFLDFSSAFNTIQPTLLRDKLSRMGVDPQLMDWISDYLTGRPQYVGLKDITSDTVVSSTGAPQGTVLAPLLFTLYTSDFCYNSELCHIQKYTDDTAIVGCIRDDREEEYRRLVGDFAAWCHTNHLQLNTSKTKELVIDFGRSRPRPRPVLLRGS
ncbi:hypothetical protein L3Q82_002527 [Scortum barcoo]|uniref:Uncharacterized protein n=1 Tax=Scortum barcoo TaxID=214431 RepID=A0ACB8VYU4_9TELE|nr:hypothetical protein L3Q82_002527 [Scortum barcoo]